MSENENTVRTKSIVVLPGDGVGPEIVAEATTYRKKWRGLMRAEEA